MPKPRENPTAAQPRGVGLIGLGYWGRNLLKTLAGLRPGRLAVCEADPARLASAGELAPSAVRYRHFDEMLRDPGIEAVCVATPVESHAAHAVAALLAGKHVFIEKPLCRTARDAARIAAASRKVRRRVMVGHIYLHHPAILRLRDWIASGRLGEVLWMRSTRCSLGPRVRNDVDVLWDYAIHDVYLAPFLAGRPVSRVRADGRPHLTRGRADWVELSMEFRGSKAVMHVFVTWLNPFKERSLMVVGSKGIAVFDELRKPCLSFHRCGYAPMKGMDRWGNVNLRLFDDGKEEFDLDSTRTLSAELAHFLACLDGREAPRASLKDGLKTLRNMGLLSASLAAQGKWVNAR